MSVKRQFWRHWLCWKLGVIVIDGGFPDWKKSWKKRGEKERERGRERERERERERGGGERGWERKKEWGGGITSPALKLKCRQVMTVWEIIAMLPPLPCKNCWNWSCMCCMWREVWVGRMWGQLLTPGLLSCIAFPPVYLFFFLINITSSLLLLLLHWGFHIRFLSCFLSQQHFLIFVLLRFRQSVQKLLCSQAARITSSW